MIKQFSILLSLVYLIYVNKYVEYYCVIPKNNYNKNCELLCTYNNNMTQCYKGSLHNEL